MLRFRTTIIATLIGLTVLLGGASFVEAQGAGWYFKAYKKNLLTADGPIESFGPYATQAACQAEFNTKTTTGGYSQVSFCENQVSAAAATQSLITSQSAATAQQKVAANAVASTGESPAEKFYSQVDCKVGYLYLDCLPLFGSYVLYLLSSGLLILSGFIFDAILSLSIDKAFIEQDFIDSTWTVLRDIANMAFIFILLYAGVQTMLGVGGNWMRTVLNVIVIALLINFSLFFTKVIIDAGNILAVGVYESLAAPSTTSHTGGRTGTLEERDISATLIKKIEPGKLFTAAGTVESGFLGAAIFTIGAIINTLIAWALLRAGLIFVGRIIGFWYLMIFSPVAFISFTHPKFAGVFHDWLKDLLKLSFVAPVFLFFLYVIIKAIAEGDILASFTAPSGTLKESTFDILFVPAIVVLMIYAALNKAVSYAKDMSGKFGETGADIGKAVLGVAGGVALGGTALVGRATIGQVAQRAAERGFGQRLAATEGTGVGAAARRIVGRGLVTTTEAARTGTFDVRGIGGPAGKAISTGLKDAGVSTAVPATAKGGFVKMEETRQKEVVDRAKIFKISKNEEGAIRAREKAAEKTFKDQGEIVKTLKKESDEARKTAAEAESTIAEAKMRTEEARKNHDEKRNKGEIDPVLKKALDDAEIAEAETIKSAQPVLEKAKQTSVKLEEASAALRSAEEQFEKTKKEVTKDIEKINTERAKAYADHTESLMQYAVSSKQAHDTAEKIRKLGHLEDKKDELAELKKALKEELKKEKEGEEKKKETH